MLKNYLKITLRNLLKGKIYSFINIAGLSVAVAVCLMIGLYVHQEWSFDRFHTQTDRLYRVVSVMHLNDGDRRRPQTSPPLAEAEDVVFSAVDVDGLAERGAPAVRNPSATRIRPHPCAAHHQTNPRDLVSSTAYRLGCNASGANLQRDPRNRRDARPGR
jgi:hypothetical protein